MALFMCILVALAVFTVLNCCQLPDEYNGGEQSEQKDHDKTAKEHSKQKNNEGYQRANDEVIEVQE